MSVKTRCCARIFDAYTFRGRKCPRNSSVARDGKPYCKQHDPERIKVKDAVRKQKRDACDERAKITHESGIDTLSHEELNILIRYGGASAFIQKALAILEGGAT